MKPTEEPGPSPCLSAVHANENPESPYFGIHNLLEHILAPTIDHYLAEVVTPPCDCHRCRRDIYACALASIKPLYYGSLQDVNEIDIQLRTLSFENIDQQIRRAIAFVAEAPHHERPEAPPVQTIRAADVQAYVLKYLSDRPLLEQLYGAPIPMCLACNEVARRAESAYCDRCGQALVMGLPSTSVRLR